MNAIVQMPLVEIEGGMGARGGAGLKTTGDISTVTELGNFEKKFGTATRRDGWWKESRSVAFQYSEAEYRQAIAKAQKQAVKNGMTEVEFSRKMCREDLYFLCRYVLSRDRDDQKLRWEYHKPSLDLAQDARFTRQLWLEPRGWLKSTTKTVGRIVQMILRNPDISILLLTGLLELGKGLLAEVKNAFSRNPRLLEWFPELCFDVDRENMVTFTSPGRKIFQKEPTVRAASRGTKMEGDHYDVIVGDDLINADDCTTREMARATVREMELIYPLLRRSDGPVYLVGTRYDFADLYGHIIENLSREAKGPFFCGVQSAENEDGTPAVPEAASAEELARWRKILESAYPAQMLQQPQNEHQRVTHEMFLYHNDGEAEIRASDLFLLTDAAFSKREEADHCALAVAAVTPAGFWDLLEYTREHLSPRQYLDRMWHYWGKYKALGGIQRITVQKATLDMVLMFFLQEDMRRRDEYLPIKGIDIAGIEKAHKRIGRLVTRLEQGKFRIRRDMPEIEDELLRWPKSPKDDLSDCLSDLAEVAPLRVEKPTIITPAKTMPITISGMLDAMRAEQASQRERTAKNAWRSRFGAGAVITQEAF